jgi:hypothetical protein
MSCRGLGFWTFALLAGVALAAGLPCTTLAQSSSSSSSVGSGLAGVAIDAEGVLRLKTFNDPSGDLMREKIAAAKSSLDPKVASFSQMRKISLNRLEQAVIDHQGTITDEMKNLAGLLRVRYIFYYPESKDIVLAGPAEGWASDVSGRTVGISSGRPTVQLQDLVVALRAFPSGGDAKPTIGCSIDPTPEGLTALQRFTKTVHLTGPPSDDELRTIAEGVRTSLGYQKISVNGISPKTHFAQVMVEADYRMKLIGIGLEVPPVRMVSYIDHAKPNEANGLRRWFFVPDYQCVRESDDQLAMELVGDGVKLVGENEVVTATGERRMASRNSKASQLFVASFTRKYPELAARSPVYAQLRNLIDLAIAAACIQKQGYCEKAGWKMEFFGNEKEYPVETYDIPKTVESAVNVISRGTTFSFPVGGGVVIRPNEAVEHENMLSDAKGAVSKLREGTKVKLAKGQWWWD